MPDSTNRLNFHWLLIHPLKLFIAYVIESDTILNSHFKKIVVKPKIVYREHHTWNNMLLALSDLAGGLIMPFDPDFLGTFSGLTGILIYKKN